MDDFVFTKKQEQQGKADETNSQNVSDHGPIDLNGRGNPAVNLLGKCPVWV